MCKNFKRLIKRNEDSIMLICTNTSPSFGCACVFFPRRSLNRKEEEKQESFCKEKHFKIKQNNLQLFIQRKTAPTDYKCFYREHNASFTF